MEGDEKLTPEDSEILTLYCDKISIAFDNLYLIEQLEQEKNSLEKRVEERTKELHQNNELLEKANQQLNHIADHDALTEIFNRRKFVLLCNQYIEELKNSDQLISLIMFDLDKFKDVNDTYGHNAGDLVLKEFASLVSQQFRDDDVFARLGGEEFSALLINKSEQAVLDRAENIRQQVENMSVKLPDNKELSITCSIGIVTQKLQDHDLFEHIYDKADQCLYQAKKSGRNRVITSNGNQ